MGTYVINAVDPTEIIAAAAVEHLQVYKGAARVSEQADPIGGLHLDASSEILFFDGPTAAINAIAAAGISGSATIRTTGPEPTQGTSVNETNVWTGGIPVFHFAGMAGVTADPTSIWEEGKFAVMGDGGHVYWDGTEWQEGSAPVPPIATGATAGIPGAWTPAGSTVPADLAATIAAGVVANPLTTWTIGQSVVPVDTNDIHWDGAAWVAGTAP